MTMTPEPQTATLTEAQWQIAHTIAQTLVKERTDANELRKAIAYLRSVMHHDDACDRFFEYLSVLVRYGERVAHSAKTQEYYRSLDKICSACLKKAQFDGITLLNILGWAVRLTYYYKNAGPIGEVANQEFSPESSPKAESERQQEIRAIAKSQEFKQGQIIEAEVSKIKGKEVTYLIAETIKLSVKEPKKFSILSVGQRVKVEVTQVRENGVPKKVKYVD